MSTHPHRPRALLGALRTAGDVDGPRSTDATLMVRVVQTSDSESENKLQFLPRESGLRADFEVEGA